MKFTTIKIANDIYSLCKNFSATIHQADHDEFFLFCSKIRGFRNALQERLADPYWRSLVRTLYRYRYVASAAPIPFNYSGGQLLSQVTALESEYENCEAVFPGSSHPVTELVRLLKSFGRCEDNPLKDSLAEHTGAEVRNSIIILRDSRLIGATQQAIRHNSRLRNIQIDLSSRLDPRDIYDRIILFGFLHWYPASIIESPRATEILVFRYSWMREELNTSPYFLSTQAGGQQIQRSPGKLIYKGVTVPNEDGEEETFSPDEILPTINWESLKVHYGDAASVSGGQVTQDETVEARAIILEGDKAVLLDASDESRANVIYAGSDERLKLKRMTVNDIDPNMFVVLRTEGGGEYIIPIANQILADNAELCRGAQKGWKQLLREAVAESSLDTIKNNLQELGSMRANRSNIRNWMSYRSIKTEQYSDFYAIMRLVGLVDEAEDYWAMMTLIDKAHLMAGQSIRRLLIKQIADADVSALNTEGNIEFDLPQAQGGSLTAFRVVETSPGTFTVPISRLGHLIDTRDAWFV